MARFEPDYSFERNGIPLSVWLWRLVGENRETRIAAGDVLWAMNQGVPSVHTDILEIEPIPDMVRQSERFKAEIRAVVVSPEFDTAEFVRRLCAFQVMLKKDWHRRVTEHTEGNRPIEAQFDRIAERLKPALNLADDCSERDEAMRRFARALCAMTTQECELDKKMLDGAESFAHSAIAANLVFDSLDEALLTAPEALHFLLETEGAESHVLRAFGRIGPAAAQFIPTLFDRLDQFAHKPHVTYGFEGEGWALAAIGRGNPNVVEDLIGRLSAPCASIRCASAYALAEMGNDVCGQAERILALLQTMLRSETEFHNALRAFASVGRDYAWVRQKVIEMAKPRPPIMRSSVDFPDQKYDAVIMERSVAIDSLPYFSDYADECVPVLIDALTSFEEYDPDEMYDGPAGRVSYVLGQFGPKAHAAAIPLAQLLVESQDDYPKAVLNALAKVATASPEILPMLEAYREPMQPEDDVSQADQETDPAGWLIHRLRSLSAHERHDV